MSNHHIGPLWVILFTVLMNYVFPHVGFYPKRPCMQLFKGSCTSLIISYESVILLMCSDGLFRALPLKSSCQNILDSTMFSKNMTDSAMLSKNMTEIKKFVAFLI